MVCGSGIDDFAWEYLKIIFLNNFIRNDLIAKTQGIALSSICSSFDFKPMYLPFMLVIFSYAY